MEPGPVLTVVGAALLGLAGAVALDVLGQTVLGDSGERVLRRPALAERRGRHRTLLAVGLVCAGLAGTAGLLWLAAATSGADLARDVAVLGTATAALTVLACGLLGLWWHRSGPPRR